MNARSAIVIAGLALVSPACASTRGYEHRPVQYVRVVSAYDEGFRHGLEDGRWAARRDEGRRYRRSFWDDGRYRSATNGYRREFGSKFEYQDGFRAGYERGYRQRRGDDDDHRRY
jgi:hypothetical protein